MNNSPNTADGSFSFQIDIRISAASEAAALVQLIAALNGSGLDYKIGGPNGKSDAARTGKSSAPAKAPEQAKSPASKPVEPSQSPQPQPQPTPLELRILHVIETKQLIRLRINKGRGVKMDIPCRILNFDASTNLMTVYHVDEKQVYTVGLTEIDDFEQ
ncbi:hypothetical protein [Cohnella soli]|uniref:Uncharacterized protein n=1 Tax=Cohnella soli TaxID=425005 RepID=A0ABW0HNQ3_9BACL